MIGPKPGAGPEAEPYAWRDDAVVKLYCPGYPGHRAESVALAKLDGHSVAPRSAPAAARSVASGWAEIESARSGRAALAAFVRGNAATLARVAAIDEVAKAAPHEPDASVVVANSEQLRREGYGNAATMLADRFGLRAGLDVEPATDLLLMFGLSPTYLTLRRYSWSDERYAAWLTATLAQQLLARPGRG